MGTPVPPPVTPPPVSPGNPCTTCWGFGKPFGVGDTPESVTANVSGINKGRFWDPTDGEPPNGLHVLPESGLHACSYRLVTANHTFLLDWTSVLSRFTIRQPSSALVFAGTVLDICKTSFTNVITFAFDGGTVEIQVPGTT